MKLYLFPAAFAVLLSMSQGVTIDEKVQEELASHGTTTVILHFKGPQTKEILSDYHTIHRPLEKTVHPDVLPSMLEANANKHQAKTLDLLKTKKLSKTTGADFFQLWAYNKIIVKNADSSLIDELLKSEEIERIGADKAYPPSFEVETGRERTVKKRAPASHNVEDGVKEVQAPEAWAQGYSGSGVTVGVIDTGIRATHERIKRQFRKKYGWFDAIDGKPTPYDDNGHGTHVAGTIVGSAGMGVAPNATVIACKAFNSIGGLEKTSIMICAQFMLCPTDPTGKRKNCSAAPKIINNSWNKFPEEGEASYDEISDLWLANNQIVIFAAGNDGKKGCSTISHLSQNKKVVSVASVDDENQVSDFSSRGPAASGIIKPDIAAPGEDINSASHTSDTGTEIKSGTSMAAPHVAGAAAIFCSQNLGLTQSQLMKKLKTGAVPTKPTGESCGGIKDTRYPNNHVGYGKLQILNGLD